MSGPQMNEVRGVLLRLLPDEELDSVKPISTSRIIRQFKVHLASNRTLLLALRPTKTTGKLRHEQAPLTSESLLISYLKDNPIVEETDPEVVPSRGLSPFSPPLSSSHLSPYSPPSSSSRLPSPLPQIREARPSPSLPAPEAQQLPSTPSLSPLASFLPVIIHHDSTDENELKHMYTIYETSGGTPLSAAKCTPKEVYTVNLQLGQLAYTMATIVSPNGTFGPALKVLGSSDPSRPMSPVNSPTIARTSISATSSPSSSRKPSVASGIGGGGSPTWDIAFRTMAEAILRDGEDMSVFLPYDLIRRHIARLSHVLRTITVSRLLLFDAGDDDNILVSRNEDGDIQLAGFRDWTAGVFGDPLLGSFWEDWDGSGPRRKGWGEGCKFIDKKTLPVRLMLYRCHRACVDIVREYYRPRKDSSEREMVARKRLTAVLKELGEVVVDLADSGAGSPGETVRREIGSPYSTVPQSPRTEPATPKRTQDEACPGQKLSPRKKPKIEQEEKDPAEADDEKEDGDVEDGSEDEEEEEEARYQPSPATARPNPASLDYILNS